MLKKTILIIDDEPYIVDYLTTLLSKKYNAMGFSSGNQCISYFQNGGKADLVISDMKMSDGDGMSVLKHLKTNKIETPFMFMTGFSEINSTEMIDAGASKIFTKPFKLTHAMKDIESTLCE